MPRRKRFIHDDKLDLTSTEVSSQIFADESETESNESETDELEMDLLYDSNEDEEYVPRPENSESDEMFDEEEYRPNTKRKRSQRISFTAAEHQARRPNFTTASTSLSSSSISTVLLLFKLSAQFLKTLPIPNTYRFYFSYFRCHYSTYCFSL